MNDGLEIGGGCHCGALGYRLLWPFDGTGETQIPGRRCSCSFCTRIGGTWTSHPDAELIIAEDTANPARRYRFGTGTADFLICSRCGVTPLAVSEIDGRTYAVVNVNTFDDAADGFGLDYSDTCFDGESVDDRLGRRRAKWIGHVEWTRR